MRAVADGAKTVATWAASVPGKLAGLARMSRAEWGVMLSGFWVAVKKEAHHFWVRRAPLCAAALRPGAETRGPCPRCAC